MLTRVAVVLLSFPCESFDELNNARVIVVGVVLRVIVCVDLVARRGATIAEPPMPFGARRALKRVARAFACADAVAVRDGIVVIVVSIVRRRTGRERRGVRDDVRRSRWSQGVIFWIGYRGRVGCRLSYGFV